MASIGDELLEHLVVSKFDDRREFLPEGYINRFVKSDTIRDGLFPKSSALDESDEDLVNFINTGAKKVFATAYCVLNDPKSLLISMRFFQSRNFNDSRLPIAEIRTSNLERDAPHVFPFPFDNIREGEVKGVWARFIIRRFYKEQWQFLAPVFSGKEFHLILPSDCVLPFIWVNHITKGGRFSHVYEVKIHEHHRPAVTGGDKLANVAIKEILTSETNEILRQEVEKNFENEAKALSEIAGLQHPHIIERVAAITRGGRHYFMFQWADGGNLREFWKANPSPKLTSGRVRDILTQLRGLADALAALHFYEGRGNYRHGDLKPENVLRFRDRQSLNDDGHIGTLKIADMGLAKHHTDETEARPDPTSAKYGTARYEPPEVSTNRLHKARSRLYDVWSFGCVVLEFMIWAFYGFQELEEFSARIQDGTGRFYETKTEGVARVHPIVGEWIHRMEKEPECSERSALRDLLQIVKGKLLVVDLKPGVATTLLSSRTTPRDLTREPISTGPSRARAEAVVASFDDILRRGDREEKYLLSTELGQVSLLQVPSSGFDPGLDREDGSSFNTVRSPEPATHF